jgi:hypothetical protein
LKIKSIEDEIVKKKNLKNDPQTKQIAIKRLKIKSEKLRIIKR